MQNLKFLLILILLTFPSIVYAKLSWVDPSFTIRETYQSNVFSTRDNAKADWITSYVPGLIFQPKLSKIKLKMVYEVAMNQYKKYDSFDYVSHNVNTDLSYQGNKYLVSVKNNYLHGQDPYGAEDITHLAHTDIKNRIMYTKNLNKSDLSLIYDRHDSSWYSSLNSGTFDGNPTVYKDSNNSENRGELEWAIHTGSKTSWLISSAYGYSDYLTGVRGHSHYMDVLTGLRGELTNKTTLDGKIGYRQQFFSIRDDDYKGLILQGTLTEKFSEKHNFIFNFTKHTEPTTYTDNLYADSTILSAVLQNLITKRIEFNISSSLEKNDYPTATLESGERLNRHDQRWNEGVELRYKLPSWAVLTLKYTYSKTTSNVDSVKKSDNIFSAGVQIVF